MNRPTDAPSALKLAQDILTLAGNEERIEVELAREVVRLSALSETPASAPVSARPASDVRALVDAVVKMFTNHTVTMANWDEWDDVSWAIHRLPESHVESVPADSRKA